MCKSRHLRLLCKIEKTLYIINFWHYTSHPQHNYTCTHIHTHTHNTHTDTYTHNHPSAQCTLRGPLSYHCCRACRQESELQEYVQVDSRTGCQNRTTRTAAHQKLVGSAGQIVSHLSRPTHTQSHTHPGPPTSTVTPTQNHTQPKPHSPRPTHTVTPTAALSHT